MLDRDNAVFSVPQLQFPSRNHIGHVKDTLVDGVMPVYCRNNYNSIIIGAGF